MKITMTFELSEREARAFLENSVERVINSSIECADVCARHAKNDRLQELGGINAEDWEGLKPQTVRLWNRAQDAVFRAKNDMPPQD